jgi:NTE family protein
MSLQAGLALGGGAALGWAHLGVIAELRLRGVDIVAVSGTSIGAVVAACLAANKLTELEQIARATKFGTVLRYLDVSFGSGGMLGGKRIVAELTGHFGSLKLEDLALPCATVAADLISGNEVVFRTGPVVEAVRASLSIPGIFAPVLRGGQILADGGLINPVPVDVVRSLTTAPIIAVNLQGDYQARAASAGLSAHAPPKSMVGLSRTALGLLLTALSARALKACPPDVELTPAVGLIDVGDFTKADPLIKAGRDAVIENWPRILAALTPHPDKSNN